MKTIQIRWRRTIGIEAGEQTIGALAGRAKDAMRSHARDPKRSVVRTRLGPLLGSLLGLLLGALLGARAGVAENAIRLDQAQPSSGPIAVGQVVEIGLAMDFDDAVIGGGFQVDYDPAIVELVDWRFARALGDEPDYRCAPDQLRCGARGGAHRVPIGFGRFDGLTGERPIGVLRLRGRAPGTSVVTLLPHASTGGFADLTGEPVATDANDLVLRVVPEPGWAGALAAGLAGLGALGRRGRRRMRV